MLKNKKVYEFLTILMKNIDILYPITIPNEPNAFSKNKIHNISSQLNINTLIKKNFKSINQEIMKHSNKYILITGSLYLIGQLRKKYL